MKKALIAREKCIHVFFVQEELHDPQIDTHSECTHNVAKKGLSHFLLRTSTSPNTTPPNISCKISCLLHFFPRENRASPNCKKGATTKMPQLFRSISHKQHYNIPVVSSGSQYMTGSTPHKATTQVYWNFLSERGSVFLEMFGPYILSSRLAPGLGTSKTSQ